MLQFALDLLQSLHVVDAGNLPHPVHDFLKVFQVGDLQHYIYAGLAVLAAGFYVADVGVSVADYGCDLFQHAKAVVAQQRELYGIGNGLAIFVSRPQYVDAAVGLVEKVGDVRTVDGVDGHSFASGYVANDGFSANRVATAGAIDEQVTRSADDDGVAVAAKDSAHCAGKSAGETLACGLLFAIGHRFSAGRRELREHLAGGVLAVADAGHQIVGTAESVFAGGPLPVGFLDVFQRDSVFASFFFHQLLADFNGTLALVDVQPVLDFVTGARRLDDGQPVAARLVSGLGDDFDDVAGMQLVAEGHHASVDFGAGATVSNLGVNRVGEVDGRGLARQH